MVRQLREREREEEENVRICVCTRARACVCYDFVDAITIRKIGIDKMFRNSSIFFSVTKNFI